VSAMNEQNDTSADLDDVEPDGWLAGAIGLASEARLFRQDGADEPGQDSSAFLRRCDEAAEVAISVLKLREERKRIGFVPLSFAEYLNGLVKVADVRISAVLRWLKIDDISRPGPAAARALARLANELGIELREALIHIRIGFAAQSDATAVPLLLARHRGAGAGRALLDDCEVILGNVEAGYDLNLWKEVQEVESEVRAAYEELGRG
jgi:hypothetical protein